MELIFRGIAWIAFAMGALFILWKVYLFVAWNIERVVFLGSVSSYLRTQPKGPQKKDIAVAAK